MQPATFKSLSRALVSVNLKIPGGHSAASNWKFVTSHPTLLLHVIVGTAILVTAVVLLVMSIRSRHRPWIVMSAIGLVFVLLAFVSGDAYVGSLRNSADDSMSVGWLGAIVTYGVAWYRTRAAALRAHPART